MSRFARYVQVSSAVILLHGLFSFFALVQAQVCLCVCVFLKHSEIEAD